MYLILIAMTVTSVTADHPILEQAFSDCHRYAKRVPEERQSIARELLEIEIEENLPSGARGLLVAAACHESAFNPRVKCGDEGSSCGIVQQNGVFSKLIRAEIAEAGCVDRAEMRPSKIKKLRALGVPMSIIRRMSKDPRRCWRASARVWVRQLIKQIPKVEASCEGYGGYSTREEFVLASAALTAVRRPGCATVGKDGKCLRRKKGPKCGIKGSRATETAHWSTLRRWRRNMADDG
jgi:hypothetical protein